MSVKSYRCVPGAAQQAPTAGPPSRCAICEDERQYVRQGGQAWTTLEELAAKGHRIEIRELEPELTGIGVEPRLGIGQRALLVQTASGNFLWDCVGVIDPSQIEVVRSKGGLAGISMSHPHFYGAMVDAMVAWSRAFGGCPVYIPRAQAGGGGDGD